MMAIKVIVTFQAKPGRRAELRDQLNSISATVGPTAPGYLGSTLYEDLDNPDGLVEIAEWDSPGAQVDGMHQATAMGVFAPVVELVATPFTATRVE